MTDPRVHEWIYVIIPMEKQNRASMGGDSSTLDSAAVFAAFCKACRNYFSEIVPVSYNGSGLMSPSTLPRMGCKPIPEYVKQEDLLLTSG